MHLLQPDEVDRLALGVVMLGSGGGGGEHETHAFAAMLRHEMRQSGPVAVLSPEEADPDGHGARVGLIGAPTVMIEKLPSGLEARIRAIHAQNRPAETAIGGQRCALNLAGAKVSKEAIHRGDWVVDPATRVTTVGIR